MKILLLLFIIFVSGCIGYDTMIDQLENTTEDIKKVNYYKPSNIPKIEFIGVNLTNYSLLITNPIHEIPIKYYLNKSQINLNYAVFYPEFVNDVKKGIEKWNDIIQLQEVFFSDNASVIVNYPRFTKEYSEYTPDNWSHFVKHDTFWSGKFVYNEKKGFGLIEKSFINISAFKHNRCQTVGLVTHEFGHALGLNHNVFINSAMNATFNCSSSINEETIDALEILYTESSDLNFANAQVNETNSLFRINVEVKNSGVTKAENISVQIYDGVFSRYRKIIPILKPDESAIVSYNNILLVLDSDFLEILIDGGNEIKETNEKDNVIKFTQIVVYE